MVTVELEVGYCDTRAEDLGWSLDLEPQPALAARELAGSGFLVELRLLGASHQVVVRAGPPCGPQPGPQSGSEPGQQCGLGRGTNEGSGGGPDLDPDRDPGCSPSCGPHGGPGHEPGQDPSSNPGCDPSGGPASGSILRPISGRVPGLDSGPICLETLACIPDRTYPVPAETQLALGRWRYTFRSNLRRHGPPDFARLLAGIEREAESGILGRYPGAPGAVTAIALDCDGPTLRWSTWHTYPGQGVIVTTHSTLSDLDRLGQAPADHDIADPPETPDGPDAPACRTDSDDLADSPET